MQDPKQDPDLDPKQSEMSDPEKTSRIHHNTDLYSHLHPWPVAIDVMIVATPKPSGSDLGPELVIF